MELGGRILRVSDGPSPVHYYGSIGNSIAEFPDASSFVPVVRARWGTRGSVDGCVQDNQTNAHGGLWRVSTYGRSAVRTLTNGRSLTRRQLRGGPVPSTDILGWRPSLVWIEITTDGGGYGRAIRIDAGQSIFVEAVQLNVGLWMPGATSESDQFVLVPYAADDVSQTVPEFGEAGVVEGIVYCDIARCESSREQGQDFAILTETYVNAAAEAPGSFRNVVIPPGARRVHISRDASGAVDDTQWAEAYEATTAGVRGAILAIQDRQLVGGPLPVGSALQLAMPLLTEPALWTLRWEIAP